MVQIMQRKKEKEIGNRTELTLFPAFLFHERNS